MTRVFKYDVMKINCTYFLLMVSDALRTTQQGVTVHKAAEVLDRHRPITKGQIFVLKGLDCEV